MEPHATDPGAFVAAKSVLLLSHGCAMPSKSGQYWGLMSTGPEMCQDAHSKYVSMRSCFGDAEALNHVMEAQTALTTAGLMLASAALGSFAGIKMAAARTLPESSHSEPLIRCITTLSLSSSMPSHKSPLHLQYCSAVPRKTACGRGSEAPLGCEGCSRAVKMLGQQARG